MYAPDHQTLVWLFSLKEPKGRIARWLEILSAFNFEIQHRSGTKHQNADTMSRCLLPEKCDQDNGTTPNLKCGPCTKCSRRSETMESSLFPKGDNNSPVEMSNDALRAVNTRNSAATQVLRWPGGYSLKELINFQDDDEHVGPVKRWKIEGPRPNTQDLEAVSLATRHYWRIWESLDNRDGLLVKKLMRPNTNLSHQIALPDNLKREVLKSCHDSLAGGHLGSKKTREKIRQRYYWFEMREDIDVWVASCDVCAANKHAVRRPKAPLGTLPVGAPMDRIATDLMGPLPKTPRGNQYILTMTYYFSKWVEVIAVPDQTAKTCANHMLNEVISRFGCPLAIHSD